MTELYRHVGEDTDVPEDGVAGPEMSQNSARTTWKEEELQRLLSDIMSSIQEQCVH